MPPKETAKKPAPTPRKNQELLDFLQQIKDKLEDKNPRDFGLYMKLYKVHGKQALSQALEITLKRGVDNKFRYFLGVLKSNEPAKTQTRKEDEAEISETEKEILAAYQKLRRGLVKKLTPRYQRVSRTRSSLYHKAAKEERKRRKT